jgi:ligand-binding sensor domain-containing protein
MASDKEGNLWVGNQGGITVFLKKGGTCRISNLPAEEVKFINTEKEGEVWIGTVKGMYRVENMSVTLSYSSEELGGSPKDMAVDGKGRIWFAIENTGIKMLDSEGNFILYSKKDGLVSNKVTSIEFYKDTLWITTEEGLSMFNTVKDSPPPPVTQIKVYPNPLIFSKGHTCMFFNVEKGSKICIYTISGKLIREIEAKSSIPSWDGKNNEGKLVGTGIYLFTVCKNGKKRTGKIAVVR